MHTASARLEAGPACTGARARGVLLAARATTSQRGLPVTPMAPADRGRLHDPACIGAKLSTSTRVQVRRGCGGTGCRGCPWLLALMQLSPRHSATGLAPYGQLLRARARARARARCKRCRGAGQDGGGERALGRYMSLPVDKFVLLDPQLIHPLGGRRNRFLLSVPRINVCARPRDAPCSSPAAVRRSSAHVRCHPRSACRASGALRI
jgi:hypothetical protein